MRQVSCTRWRAGCAGWAPHSTAASPHTLSGGAASLRPPHRAALCCAERKPAGRRTRGRGRAGGAAVGQPHRRAAARAREGRRRAIPRAQPAVRRLGRRRDRAAQVGGGARLPAQHRALPSSSSRHPSPGQCSQLCMHLKHRWFEAPPSQPQCQTGAWAACRQACCRASTFDAKCMSWLGRHRLWLGQRITAPPSLRDCNTQEAAEQSAKEGGAAVPIKASASGERGPVVVRKEGDQIYVGYDKECAPRSLPQLLSYLHACLDCRHTCAAADVPCPATDRFVGRRARACRASAPATAGCY